jgi:pimeloyl-ACP methyl ester carboxylesterase
MATYVLIHGGGHGGWCYQKVARRLRAAGHEVYTPTLTGLGERAHLVDGRVDLNLHIQDIVAVLDYEDLRDVILVGHSYGGVVITGVGDQAADRVGKLVFLDAANPKDGESLVDVAGPVIKMTRTSGETIDGVELVLLPSREAGMFYGVTNPADLDWMANRLTSHPWICFEQKLRMTHPSEFAKIPQFHIVCSSTVLTRDQEMIASAKAAGRFWEIDTGHDLMITEPEKVTAALIGVAAADSISGSVR